MEDCDKTRGAMPSQAILYMSYNVYFATLHIDQGVASLYLP